MPDNPSKKVTVHHNHTRRPPTGAAELKILIDRISELVAKSPDKAAFILTTWIRSRTEKDNKAA
jgi:flagellar biosynthesis/type III secretory pathway M-ring protein FliF/YscJ